MNESYERRKAFQELWDNVTEFIAKSQERNAATDEWRQEVKNQLKEMSDRLFNLPCKERSNIYINIEKSIDDKFKNANTSLKDRFDSVYGKMNWIWLLILLIIGELVRFEWIKK